MKRVLITITLALFTLPIVNAQEIKLNGTVSAENNQIKNVADPTETQDAVTKNYTYSKAEVDILIVNLQGQIDNAEAVDGSVVDIDRNKYEYINYGVKSWTIKNAEVERYNDGTEILKVTSVLEWTTIAKGAWCYYDDNDPSKGKLYNWYAVMGIHNPASLTDSDQRLQFAPEGWHVPSDDEWTELEDYLILAGYNFDNTSEGIAKAMASKTGWDSSTNDNTGAVGNNQSINNSSGFNAFPAGYRSSNDATSHFEGEYAFFWSSNQDDGDYARNWYLHSEGDELDGGANSKKMGYSVRFVRDE